MITSFQRDVNFSYIRYKYFSRMPHSFYHKISFKNGVRVKHEYLGCEFVCMTLGQCIKFLDGNFVFKFTMS